MKNTFTKQNYYPAIAFAISTIFCNFASYAETVSETVDVTNIKAKKYGFDDYTVEYNPNKILLNISPLQSLSLYSHLEHSQNKYVIFYSKKLPAPDFYKCESLSLVGSIIRLKKKFPAKLEITQISSLDLERTQEANCAIISLKDAREKLGIKPK